MFSSNKSTKIFLENLSSQDVFVIRIDTVFYRTTIFNIIKFIQVTYVAKVKFNYNRENDLLTYKSYSNDHVEILKIVDVQKVYKSKINIISTTQQDTQQFSAIRTSLNQCLEEYFRFFSK